MLKQWLKKDHIAIQMLLLASLLLPCLFCWLLGNLYVENIPLGVVDLDNSSFPGRLSADWKTIPALQSSMWRTRKP